jgi:S-adenosylmethionine:tRNA ribosyltransferase-isomerase
VTDLRLGPGSPLHVVDGLLTGMHDPATSHHQLLQAFAALPLLRAAEDWATTRGFVGHEFGDSTLLLPAGAS